jgi:hypothetical protein
MDHIAHMGQGKHAYTISVRKPERKYPLEDLGVDERVILEWIL